MNDNNFVYDRYSCEGCKDTSTLDFDFTMAFQPIVNCKDFNIFGYEALVRGLNNESAYSVISKVTTENRYLFDQLCRTKAISLAAMLNIEGMLSINFLPNAIYKPERCIRTTIQAAKKYNFPIEKILFEFTEVEKVDDQQHLKNIVKYYQSIGLKTAIDDFGAGYSGLGLLADFQTDIIKLDMGLIRNIDHDLPRQIIVRHCIELCKEFNITLLAEGVETIGEAKWLLDAGIYLMQGYYFAKPGFESLPTIDLKHIAKHLHTPQA